MQVYEINILVKDLKKSYQKVLGSGLVTTRPQTASEGRVPEPFGIGRFGEIGRG